MRVVNLQEYTHPKFRSSRRDSPDNSVARLLLPDEILLDIFAILGLQVLQHARLYYNRITMQSTFMLDSTIPLGEDISTIRNAILVPRSWRAVGTEFLYQHIVITSPRRYRLLSRTLEKSPHLSCYVQSTFVADIRMEPSFPMNLLRQQDRVPERIQPHLSSIFQYCTYLDKLFLSLQHPLSDRVASEWLQRPPITSRLRYLTLSGRTLMSTFSHLSLPLLEILCLRAFTFQHEDTVVFPQFPKLHTLQLARTTDWKSYHRIFASITALPSLTCLELYENDYQSSLAANEYTLPDFPHLQTLKAFGTYEYILFSTRWVESPTLGRIRHLGVGVADNGYDSLDEWEIPPTLESLSVAMRLDLPNTSHPQEKPLRYLLGFLRRNSAAIALGVFKEVVILGLTWHSNDPWSQQPIRAVIQDIEEFCFPLRVRVILKRSSTSFSV